MAFNAGEPRDRFGMWTSAPSIAAIKATDKARVEGTFEAHQGAAEAHKIAAATARQESLANGQNKVAQDALARAAEHDKMAASHERMARAVKSQVRTAQHEQLIADKSEKVLSTAIGIPRTKNNSAFDLRNDEVGIEVKTLVNGKNEKITMSKAALGRKLAEQQADGIRGYTVVVDRRSGGLNGQATYYIKQGFGSFRLGSMEKTTLSQIKERVK